MGVSELRSSAPRYSHTPMLRYSSTVTDPTTSSFIEESARIWDAKAEFWDSAIGPTGNEYHRTLVAPAMMRLLALKAGEHVLDIACGNGQFAREMSRVAAHVEAFDVSPRFIEIARSHTAAAGIGNISYSVRDATNLAAMLELGEGRFDAASACQALMDIPVLEPLYAAVRRLLKPGGRFAFSVSHPCFNQAGARMALEQEEVDGHPVEVYSVRVTQYLHNPAGKSVGIRGASQGHWDFSRSLTDLLRPAFEAGLVLDGLEEPAFPPSTDPQHPFSWRHYQHIPPVLVARLRKPG
jgi:SAM-dependent methyltransferase